MPRPPRRGAAFFAFAREALALRLPGRGGFVAFLRAALPRGVRAPAVLRRPPLLAAAARRPAPARLLAGVGPRRLPLRVVDPARLPAFLAILEPLSVIDAVPLSDVSSTSYRNPGDCSSHTSQP